ncbi:MAG: hypothetical protein V4574_02675 [Pseudomonadota bacterium]
MSFTEAERRKWHADRRAGIADDEPDSETSRTTCSHCGIGLDSASGNSDFPLCAACDD